MNHDDNRHAVRRASIERSLCEAPERSTAVRERPIRMLRLAQVIDMTGLGKTKIYELQAGGAFPMRVKITAHSVGWIEDEVQAWLARRVQASTPISVRL
jgi:prophage regulatory protein